MVPSQLYKPIQLHALGECRNLGFRGDGKKIPKPNQPKHHKQTKTPPFSVQTEQAACIISVTSVCDRNSSVVQFLQQCFCGFWGCLLLVDRFLPFPVFFCIYVNSFFSSTCSFPTTQLPQGELLASVRPQSNLTGSSSNSMQGLLKQRRQCQLQL